MKTNELLQSKDDVHKSLNKIINDQTEVSEMFNKFFINVAKDIGSSNIKFDDIKNNYQQTLYRQFSFL
jgi:hypothetical protein